MSKKRCLGALLAVVMIMTMLPTTALAASVPRVSETAYEYDKEAYLEKYTTTLGGIHGRRLYTYGLISGVSDEPFAEWILALDGQFTWPQLCMILSRLTTDMEQVQEEVSDEPDEEAETVSDDSVNAVEYIIPDGIPVDEVEAVPSEEVTDESVSDETAVESEVVVEEPAPVEIIIPEAIPVWAEDAYRRVVTAGWITEDDVAKPMTGTMLCDVLSRLLQGTKVVDTQAELHVASVTRNDAFRLISQALDLEIQGTGETLHDWADRNGFLVYRDEFFLPYRLHISTTCEEDAWAQIRECLDYGVRRIVVHHVGEGDVSYFTNIDEVIMGNRDGVKMDEEYDQEYLYWEYFYPYHFGCWSSLDANDDKLMAVYTPDTRSDTAYLWADMYDWLYYYKTDELETAYITYVDEVLDPLRELSEYEKVKAVNQLICRNSHYNYAALRNKASNNEQQNAHSLFGYFHNGSIVCDGYAETARLFLMELGVKCVIVIGTGNGEGHAWNKVCVDGQWYNLDVCWNDTCGNSTQYLLKSDKYMLSHDHDFDGSDWLSQFYAAPDNYVYRPKN